jgi:predicted MPP superfamily phosphohydrolase
MNKTLSKLKKYWIRIILSIVAIIIIAPLWLWFYETRLIQVETHKIQTGFNSKFVLISDLHLGNYKNKDYLEEIVRQINEQKDIEFVVIAGDLIYPNRSWSQDQLDDMFSPISDIKIPVLVTFGNHENGTTDPDLTDQLEISLKKVHAKVMEEQETKINGVEIVGLLDYWEKPESYKYLNGIETPINIVIAHNPDTVDVYDKAVGLTVAGHTHCGQIRIPTLYESRLPIVSGYEKGLYNTKNGKVFVSCGLGETGYPFRVWNRPTIYVIETV